MKQALPLAQRYPKVRFGTSGLRALVDDLSQVVVAAYVQAFAVRLAELGLLEKGSKVALGMDLRPSSPEIAATVCSALDGLELGSDFLGVLATPALALYCQQQRCAGIMITGSHIPFDRNGLKFYRPDGEITKDDERAMSDQRLDDGAPASTPRPLPAINPAGQQAYLQRYLDYFGSKALRGLRLGHYQHSASGRDLSFELFTQLGAEVIALGRSDAFVPVDTEAVSAQDQEQAAEWCRQHHLDALVSSDGDGDRPLLFDACGQFVRGDQLGLLCARQLAITALAVPLTCNTGIETCGSFELVERTRIGSPYVIAAMQRLLADGAEAVGGFEANGGFMLASALPGLPALPTRDALLPTLAVLVQIAQGSPASLSDLVAKLPARFTSSDRLANVDVAATRAHLAAIEARPQLAQKLLSTAKSLVDVSTLDGLRLTFTNGDILHLRLSGNAPELRCYAEAASPEAAQQLVTTALCKVSDAIESDR